ncbi:zinc finger matrin-type protein 3-like [Lutzomyia longipalpis]|uniref:zinc finger matrin-type protein 3-like n=1 Tax=Lutzomyia longipalpis TaxID=7200 RepID=UPI0024847093|nr:zinc finger matrin-type protein 3-like [Lutzomyia longipalpis]XP_055693911.1 zinc finger matrin-type protein 3-like [Lutzomyia longipalpis]
MSTESTFTGEYYYSSSNFKIPKVEQERRPESAADPSDEYSGLFGVVDNVAEYLDNMQERFGQEKNSFDHKQTGRKEPQRKRKAEMPPKEPIDGDQPMLDVQEAPPSEPSTKRNRVGHVLMEMLEEDLPAELKSLMRPLCCDLCNVKLNSVLTANMHYESKNHDKKINNWLLEWSKKTGQPPPKRQKTIKDGPVGPNAFHCEACDIPLTSLQHARTHYSGRKHQLVVSGRTNPSGSGYYNPEGKWVRQSTKTVHDPTGRFGIGTSFVAPPPPPAAPTTNQAIFCKLCNISVTSDSQMKLHLEGAKHNKRLKASTDATFPPTNNDTVMESIVRQQSGYIPPKRDISIHRTPSGNYYCNVCDVTVNNDNLFNQHLDSKKHMKKLKASQQQQQ